MRVDVASWRRLTSRHAADTDRCRRRHRLRSDGIVPGGMAHGGNGQHARMMPTGFAAARPAARIALHHHRGCDVTKAAIWYLVRLDQLPARRTASRIRDAPPTVDVFARQYLDGVVPGIEAARAQDVLVALAVRFNNAQRGHVDHVGKTGGDAVAYEQLRLTTSWYRSRHFLGHAHMPQALDRCRVRCDRQCLPYSNDLCAPRFRKNGRVFRQLSRPIIACPPRQLAAAFCDGTAQLTPRPARCFAIATASVRTTPTPRSSVIRHRGAALFRPGRCWLLHHPGRRCRACFLTGPL
jgi:hypothetical protein